ncbi:MAG: hypothetical protein K2P46_00290, partial [Alistipes sp.]|nr:hypothetical protein [Alistipes sp.]
MQVFPPRSGAAGSDSARAREKAGDRVAKLVFLHPNAKNGKLLEKRVMNLRKPMCEPQFSGRFLRPARCARTGVQQ